MVPMVKAVRAKANRFMQELLRTNSPKGTLTSRRRRRVIGSSIQVQALFKKSVLAPWGGFSLDWGHAGLRDQEDIFRPLGQFVFRDDRQSAVHASGARPDLARLHCGRHGHDRGPDDLAYA